MSTSKKLSSNVDKDTSHRALVVQQTEFAYKQYQKALQEMRNALERAGDSRKALMGCILVCCFESLVGNIASAHAHGMAYSHSNLPSPDESGEPGRSLRNHHKLL
jgi:hypothetical protein